MRPITQPGIIAGALIAVLVLAGCAPASTTSSAPGDPGLAFELITGTGRYQHNSHVLGRAEETLVARCMTARGVHYEAGAPQADGDTGGERDLPLSRRRQEGYGLYRSYTEKSAEQDTEPSYGPAFERAYFGDDKKRRALRLPDGSEVSFPGDGCLYESRLRIHGDILVWARVEYVPETFNNKFSAGVEEDPAYRTSLQDWSRCMARKGYQFARPADAYEHLSARYAAEGPSSPLRQQEVAIAVSDGECADEIGIAPLVLSIRKRQFDSLPAAERAAIDEIAADWQNAVVQAENILRGSRLASRR